MTSTAKTSASEGASLLEADVSRAGYYPELVMDVLDVALAGESVTAGLVQAETTFAEAVHRHLTVLALTTSRLIVVHVDDVPRPDGRQGAVATSEIIPVWRISSMSLTRGVSRPENGSGQIEEVTLAVSWGAVRRLELEPTGCDDPNCEANHGLTGVTMPDDVIVRIAAGVEGREAVERAHAFARALSAATAEASRARL